ncbi:MAG: hypothetical protein M3167_16680 [Acidobacteriota bacterium]|nr:hypothetical protein [Acidobacteriota bacterium]
MLLRQRPPKPSTLIRLGMACLLVALVLPRFVQPSARLGEDLFDGFRGLFIGLSIGLNLWGVWLNRHNRPI